MKNDDPSTGKTQSSGALLDEDKTSPKIVQLSPAFTTIDVKNFILAHDSVIRRAAFSPDSFQIALLISVVNAVFAKYKVPIRLTTSVSI